uniref:Uncharacterized protein n=1 Tax=Vitrella brassicaformis TaxID=1169539 RepID=A0A7S1NZN2_9ALVE
MGNVDSIVPISREELERARRVYQKLEAVPPTTLSKVERAAYGLLLRDHPHHNKALDRLSGIEFFDYLTRRVLRRHVQCPAMADRHVHDIGCCSG